VQEDIAMVTMRSVVIALLVLAYAAAARFFAHTLDVVRIPHEGSAIVVHLHRPAGDGPALLIVWNGGVDWWKAGYHGLIEALVRRGFAVAAFDLPGTGESMAWTASVNGGRDPFAPMEDLELVRSPAVRGETWILGSSGHCAIEYSAVVWPQVFDWLAERLLGAAPSGAARSTP
jgi:hypothetical protein